MSWRRGSRDVVCLLSMTDGEPTGWIIAADLHDLRRQVEAVVPFDARLAPLPAELYRMEYAQPGKHRLSTGYFLLVS